MTIDRRVSYRIHKLIENNYFKGGKRIANFLSKILLPLPKGKVAVENRENKLVILNPNLNKGIETSLYYSGKYEAGIANVIENFLIYGDYFFELGANVAPHSMLASMYIGEDGRAYAFEPDPAVKDIIDRNIRLNTIRNIITENYGLGNKRSTMKLYINTNVNRGASSLIQSKKTKCIDVKIDVFDEYFDRSNISKCSMIVLDVEGWELQVLQGASRTIREHRPLLCTEVNSLYSPKEIYDYISSFKFYKIYQLAKPKEYVSKLIEVKRYEDLRLDDNIFCLTEKHISSLANIIS